METATAKISQPATLAEMTKSERVLLQHEVEQFLYYEASLLDARHYQDWLKLIAKDIHYWMPIRRTVTLKDIDQEFTKPGDMAYFDDAHEHLVMRVKKLEAGSAWSEDPPSRSRHFVSNVRILDVTGDEISLETAFHLYRSRLNTEESNWYGRRVEGLRRHGDSQALHGRCARGRTGL